MSSFAGFFSFGNARDNKVLQEMSNALPDYGSNTIRQLSYADVSMVFHDMQLGLDSCSQPVLTDDGLLAVWDGRLDNRDDLGIRIGLTGKQADVHIVLEAYRFWGESFVDHLVGDFALVLWSFQNGQLILARDPLAARPLFFAFGKGKVLWASTIKALFASREITSAVNDEWLSAFIIEAEPIYCTPFTMVETVAPGEIVIFTSRGLKNRYFFWEPSLKESIYYRRDEDYEEAFREIFFEAVRCRLRVKGTVFAELSGGVDSSSIVCVANHLINHGDTETENLYTQSWIFNQAYESDERDFIKVVEDETGRNHFHFLEDDYPILADIDKRRFQVPNGYQIWPLNFDCTLKMMRQNGSRVLLSGFAGDQLMWSQIIAPFHLADHLWKMKPHSLIRELSHWHKRAGYAYPFLVWEGLFKPLWGAALRRSSYDNPFSFHWLSKRLRDRRASLFKKSLERVKGFVLPSTRMRYDSILLGINGRSWLNDEIEHGFETWYPFLDRRLVEFILAIPFEQLVRPHEMRSLHRRALKDFLPEKIRNRQCKASPSQAFMYAFRREWLIIEKLFHDQALVYDRGLVNREGFKKELINIRHGLYGDYAVIIRVIQIEVWLRSIETIGL